MSTAVQHSFGGGEIAPVLYSRVDTQKYSSGCKTLRNNLITRSGALMNRAGTQFAGEVKDSTKTVRLIPFIFSNTQAYVLEFGDLYVRFYQNGNQITEQATTISAITNANPGVITDTAHGYSNGDEVFISGIIGAIGTYLNNRNFKVAGVTTNTYTLTYMDGTVVNTTSQGSYTSGGTAARVYTVVTPYAYNILQDLKFVQSADIMTLVHQNYPPQQLSRTSTIVNGINTWTMTTMLFNPSTPFPINAGTISQDEIQQGGAGYWSLGTPTTGTGVLFWNGSNSGLLNYGASNSTIQTAVNSMVGGSGRCTVSNQFTGLNALTFTFIGTLANSQQPLITCASAFYNAVNPWAPTQLNITEIQIGGAASGASGPYNFKYKTTAVNKKTGEESLSCTSGSVSISAITTRGTNGTICQITATSHGLSSGDEIVLNNMTVAGVPQLATGRYIVTVLDVNNFVLNGVDSTTFGVYTSGGTLSYTFVIASGKATPTPSNPITVNPGAVDLNQVGLINVYKQINGVYGFVGSIKPQTTFSDTNVNPDTSVQPPQFQTLFSTVNNYPSCVTYYQQRLCFANTINTPMGFWASQVGLFNNFNFSANGVPVSDSDAVIFQLASEKVDPIMNMINVGNLILLTQNSEYAILGNNTGGQYGTLTPTAINATLQSHHGSASVRPILVQGSAVYLQARSSILRDLLFNLEEDKYKGNDLTTFATHLFDIYTIVDMDYQQIPNSYLWAVRSDGTLLSLTYNKEQQIFAWSHHDTSGTFENVCVIPEGNADVAYFIANRLVDTNGVTRNARYVERMTTRNVEISSVPQMTFMDCSGVYNGVNPGVSNLRNNNTDLLLTKGYASTPSNSDLNVSSPTKFTIRGWIKLDGDNFNNGLATRSDLAGDQGDWSFGFFTGNSNQLLLRTNTGISLMSSVVSKGVWHFVEANYDSNASVVNIFIDGNLDATSTANGAITNNSNPLVLGNYYDTSMNYAFNGEMSEWEYCANYIRNTASYIPPVVITPDANTTVCYHMTDGKGTTLADSSGNGLTSTLTGSFFLGYETMTLTGGTNWNANELLTMTCSKSFFTSVMVGDDIRFTLSDGTPLIFTIQSYSSATVVKVLANKNIPVAYQGTALTAWSSATKNISGLWYLENHAVSVLGDGYVMASPYNGNYGQLVVSNGQITLPKNASYVIVGCPYISDFKSLDVDVVGYSVFMGKTAIDKWKNITEVTAQVVNTRGGWAGVETPETNVQNYLNNKLFQLYEIKPRLITTNANLPPELITDNIRVTVAGGSNIHGNVFIRQPDPIPFCLSQLAFAGDIPLRDADTNPPKGAVPNGR